MINEQLHKTPVALDRVKHRALKLDRTASDMTRLKQLNSFFVSVGEFAEACKEFPLVWVAAGKADNGKAQVAPLAVFGLQSGSNLCIDEGQWRVRYVPAQLRYYPFATARTSPTETVLCVDEAWKGLSYDSGEPLFKPDGEPSELTAGVNQQLQELEVDIERTRMVGERLVELGLLREMRFEAQLPEGKSITVDGFMTIDGDKLGKLSDSEVLELSRNGILGIIHAHQISMSNMNRLAEWHAARAAVTAAPAAPAPAAPTH